MYVLLFNVPTSTKIKRYFEKLIKECNDERDDKIGWLLIKLGLEGNKLSNQV